MGKHSAPKAPLPLPSLGQLAAGASVPVMVVTGLGAGISPAAAANGKQEGAVRPAAPDNARFMPPTDDELERLRSCEASGRYSTNTGNGFYGAYQFDLQTWRGLGLAGYPHEAAPDTQDAAAAVLEETRGWQPWPSCSRRLSLIPRRSHALSVQQILGQVAETAVQAVMPQKAPVATHATPSFQSVLSVASAHTYRSDVRLWQERMARRGWPITVDGFFGPQSAAVARAFAAEKHIVEGFPGEVGPQAWHAAWALPVG